jgi:hypothetical protein
MTTTTMTAATIATTIKERKVTNALSFMHIAGQ